jgi:hypothetical protein
MAPEEAVVRSLRDLRRDPTVPLSLPRGEIDRAEYEEKRRDLSCLRREMSTTWIVRCTPDPRSHHDG